jgi:hypothetical protein
LVGALTVSSLGHASAVDARCDPHRTNQASSGFAGTTGGQVAIQGVKADIEEDNPWVSNNSEVFAWVMLTGGQHLAQAGWENDDYNDVETRSIFAAVINDQLIYVQNNVPDPYGIGTRTTYQTTYTSSTKSFSMTANGSVVYSTTMNWVPDGYEIYAETHARSDQMPGAISNHEQVLNTYQKHGGSWWSLTSPTYVTNATYYGASRINSVDYEIWDKYCA